MAKKGNELTTQNNSTALAVPDHLRGGAMIEGEDATLSLGRMALYQGTMEEQARYEGSDFKPGDFIDVLEKRKLASSRIVPVTAFKTWVKWPQGAMQPEYVHRDKSMVPPEDQAFGPNGEPPVAVECINTVVLVEGEPWPYLFVFKKTAIAAGRDIFKLEARRGSAGQGRGLYELGSKTEQNKAKQSYKKLTMRPVGNCPETLVPLLEQCISQIDRVKSEAENKAAEDHGGGDDNEILV